ncbi:hypothetical protein FC83_GL001472 [Agrilactobacillus composti DSM 18527 = JCM 14202]|uniref:Amidohydrolase-related domain-containing protein n=1 Tax=Agrilactobacillus composti DSM 18527 = JCM 14202 TaxID=1423734 RepID=X0PFV5_9LACO|nr:amidohydrolase family protein [Agrilactobacillus composti]KRM30911.1 hypothetical protein FC83_GL001472 [Agrilactobacillus composti DSM 18527 = JCM 14202]GAF40849.1 2-pyrone-4,6-dicarboxylic acid hydrolase, putative [Agrilactobacillus composti DSM 18527 = JCM 14202]
MQKIFDSHFHIIDPAFPLIENNGFLPAPYTTEQYLTQLQELGLTATGGAVVSGSFQGNDQTYFEPVLKALGKNFVGITQLPTDTTDQAIRRLDGIGIKGIRFNFYRGLGTPLADVQTLARRVYDLCGWQTEFYLNLATADPALLKLILALPKVSIDHLGMAKVANDDLKRLLAAGIPLRLTGFGRVAYSRAELTALIPGLYQENPDGLIFGSDLPGTRAKYSFTMADVDLVAEALHHDPKAIEKVLRSNGENWYL